MKKLIIIIALWNSISICNAQKNNYKNKNYDYEKIQSITIQPIALIDQNSQRLQLNYQQYMPKKRFSFEVGGAYIFNEMESYGISDYYKNYWANGWNATANIKWYNKRNELYFGLQTKMKYNYMHWMVYEIKDSYFETFNVRQVKSVYMDDVIFGCQEISKRGIVNDISILIGLRFRSFKNNSSEPNQNILNQYSNTGFLLGPPTDDVLPEISICYKIGFAFKRK